MYKLTVSFLLAQFAMFLSLDSQASQSEFFSPQTHIFNEKNCFRAPFDSYESWLAMITKSSKKRSKSEYELSNRIHRFKTMFPQSEYENFKKNVSCVTFRYKVEDVWVNGYAIKLKTVKKLPVIVYNRGGNGSYGSVGFAAMIGRLMPLANKGFIVVGSQYRGNYRKSKVKDEFGGADVQDVLTLIDNLEFLHHADLERVGLYGSSRGTMQSMMVLRERSEPFKAVVLSAGIYDLEAQLAFRPEMENVYKNRIPNYESQKSSQLKKRSAIYWSDEIETNLPILLLHGELDKRVDVSNSIKLAEKFEENGRPYKLRIFEGDDHSLTNNREAANAELLNWFANQLKIEE